MVHIQAVLDPLYDLCDFYDDTQMDALDPTQPTLQADPAATIERLRKQAKQRFIGAAVLVLMAVVGLPFLLDAQPRALSSNIAIDIPRTESKLAALDAAPPPPPPPTAATPTIAPALAPSIPAAVTTPAPVPAPAPAPVAPAAAKNAPLVFAPTDDKKAEETQRAAALLNGETLPPKSAYIVQAGSYTDLEKLQSAQAKLTSAGFKHYTQLTTTKEGKSRTRLRLVGPFKTKDEATAAANRVTALGIATIVLKP
jgi:DedD protein